MKDSITPTRTVILNKMHVCVCVLQCVYVYVPCITLTSLLSYRKRGKICWAKLSRFSRFSGVPRKFFHEYKCLSLILNNEYLCTTYDQGNAKMFP